MTRLRNIVRQVSDEDYQGLCNNLKQTKADKFLTLLKMLRENNDDYSKIQKKIKVNASAFYTIKSRLYDKIQDYLLEHMETPKVDLLKNVAAIPRLVYDTSRETAVALLSKMETDLKAYDMPGELTSVYAAFKNIYLNSPKYYDYAKQYNKHVAYTVALDKAEDLLGDFIRKLSHYLLSRNEELLEVFPLIKMEMDNVCALYESHHLYIYHSIINACIDLFLPPDNCTKDDEPIEDMLEKCEDFISRYPRNQYQYLRRVISFLYFEYYHKMERHRKEAEFFEAVNIELPNFLLYNFCCPASLFLLSKTDRYIKLGQTDVLIEESKLIEQWFNNDTDDIFTFINVKKYLAVCAFYDEDYAAAASILNDLLNTIGLKDVPHTAVEIKLFLSLCYSMVNKYDLAWNILRSASRKVNELNKIADYENASYFIKLMKMQMKTGQKNIKQKLSRLWENFRMLNRGPSHMLEYLHLDEKLISKLAKPIK